VSGSVVEALYVSTHLVLTVQAWCWSYCNHPHSTAEDTEAQRGEHGWGHRLEYEEAEFEPRPLSSGVCATVFPLTVVNKVTWQGPLGTVWRCFGPHSWRSASHVWLGGPGSLLNILWCPRHRIPLPQFQECGGGEDPGGEKAHTAHCHLSVIHLASYVFPLLPEDS
jgi:hypothetical protein